MNSYIIDPSVFYWINVLGILQTVFAIIGGILTAIAIACVFGCVYNAGLQEEYEDNKRYLKIFKKWLAITLPIGIFFIFISVFIPGKATSIEMLIAKTATFDNVDWTVAQIKEIVDYIVTAIKGVV